jgi:hypothetical protein
MRRTELHSNTPKRLEPPNDWQSEKRMAVSPDKMVQKLSAIQALPVSIAVLDSRGTIVKRHPELPPLRHEELPPPLGS